MLGRPGIRLLFLPALPGPCLASLLGQDQDGPANYVKRIGTQSRSIRGKDKSSLSTAAKRKYLRGSLLRTGEHEPFQHLFLKRIAL